ncbi:MAG: hypothetical protein ACJ8EY_05250 [Sphingomicrobium sp.]
MSRALRVLGLTLAGWVGVRAWALGAVPGSELAVFGRSEAKPAPIQPTIFPSIDPPYAMPVEPPFQPQAAQFSYPTVHPVAVPVYYAATRSAAPAAGMAMSALIPLSGPSFERSMASLEEWPLSRFSAASVPTGRSTVTLAGQSTPATFIKPGLDRLQLTAWTLLRGRQGVTVSPNSLVAGGTLGGSQAGARLTYNFTRTIAASLRTTSPVGGSGGEVAAGIKFTPLPSVPLSITAERRKAIGRYSGHNGFSAFIEGGFYQQPLWGMQLDGYAQAGVVGVRERAYFADGGLTLTRPLFRNFSGGLGVWGGMQPGLYRIDAGPRLSMRVRNNMRVHLDWRQRVAGNALPRSGPAVTLAGDF